MCFRRVDSQCQRTVHAEGCSADPPILVNGKVQKGFVEHNSTVTYECDEGYVLEGTPILQCLYGEWVGNHPFCFQGSRHLFTTESNTHDPRRIESSSSKETTSSVQPFLSSSTIPTHSATTLDYEDKDESLMMGANTCHCTHGSTDTKLVAYADNQLLQLGSKVKNGSTVKFHCKNFGYHILVGHAALTCLYCAQWSHSFPYCKDPEIGDLSISFGVNTAFLPGGIVALKKGMSALLTCYESNHYPEWKSPPASHVSTNKNVAHGEYTIFYTTLEIEKARMEDSGEYKCFDYTHQKNRSFVLQITEPLVCFTETITVKRNQVIRLKPHDSIRIICSGTIESPKWIKPPQSRASVANDRDSRNKRYLAYLDVKDAGPEDGGKYACLGFHEESFELTLQITATRCPTFTNLDALIVDYDRNRVVNSSAVFTCKKFGEIIEGSKILTCMPNGQWSGALPVCKEITCPELKVDESKMSISYSSKDRILGDKATFECLSPYQRVKRSEIKCVKGGVWSDGIPTCEYVSCSRLNVNELEITVSYSDGLNVGSKATFECLAQRQIVGNLDIKCEINGTWSGAIPSCKNIVCYYLKVNTLEMTVSYSDGLIVGSKATFECLPHRQRVGNSQITCEREGTWSDAIPTCESISGCSPLQIPASSNLIVEPRKPFYMFGESITFSCPDGQVLSEDVYKVVCLLIGWSEKEFPNCVNFVT